MIQEKQYLWRTLEQFGSVGVIHHKIETSTTEGYNRYDEEGNETNVDDVEQYELYKCKYSIRTRWEGENTNLSLSDIHRVVTIKLDNEVNISKSDIFEDVLKNKFSIVEIWRLGDRQGDRVFYRLLCKQD